jgi:predicted RNA-binding Zn-ribbon protein involved in translation (DUF1610 family)
MLAGFIVFLSVVIIAIILILQARAKKKKALGKTEMRCPKCGTFVDSHCEICPSCNAEFLQDEYECPVCGRSVHYGIKKCKCGASFEEKKEVDFICPNCGAECEAHSEKCAKCGVKIWSPVRPAK